MINTQPIFIIGTGRSGTRNLFKTLSGVDDIEIFHLPDYREAKGLLIEAQAPTVKPAVLHFPVQW